MLVSSLYGSALIVGVLALSKSLGPKLSSRCIYALWVIVFLRLMIPGAFTVYHEKKAVGTGLGQESAPVPAPQAPDLKGKLDPAIALGDAALFVGHAPFPAEANKLAFPHMAKLGGLLWIIWMIPAVAVLAFKTASYRRYMKKLKASFTTPSGEQTQLLARLAAERGIRRKAKLCLSPLVSSACAIGLFRPVVILSDREFGNEQLCFIFKHELAHVKRFDSAFVFLMEAVKAIQWFNPLVRLAAREAAFHREASCDEAALRGSGFTERKAYSLTMIETVDASSMCISMSGRGTQMKKRISAIMDGSKKTSLKVAAAAVIASIALCACSAMRIEEKTEIIPESVVSSLESSLETEEPISEPVAAAAEKPLIGKTNVLVAGCDVSGKADVIVVASYDHGADALNLVWVPRDVGVIHDGKPEKFSSLANGSNGMERLQDEVEELLSIDVDYNVKLGMEAFAKLVDSIGGVEIEVPESLYYIDPFQDLNIALDAGLQTLNGEKALEFARYRYTYPNGDLDRIAIQQQMVSEMCAKLLNGDNLAAKAKALFSIVLEDTATNMTLDALPFFLDAAMSINQSRVDISVLPSSFEDFDKMYYGKLNVEEYESFLMKKLQG
jgi:LCP family protein required for cell wall assembly